MQLDLKELLGESWILLRKRKNRKMTQQRKRKTWTISDLLNKTLKMSFLKFAWRLFKF
jgi:hypothetical protein